MTDVSFATRFTLASLATWRVTHLLSQEDGPSDLVAHLRARLGNGQLGELMDCFFCLSIWVAAPFSLTVARRGRETPLTWLAVSGAACLLELATQRPGEADAIASPTVDAHERLMLIRGR
jgi:Protein of unknown function (DUF1360)